MSYRWFTFALTLLTAASAAAQTQPFDFTATEQAAAAQYGVPVQVLQDLIFAESSNNVNVGCNSAGACGVAQFMPATAAQYNVNVNDPTSSIYGAANYLATLQQQTGSYTAALTSYSGGCTPAAPCNAAYGDAFTVAQAADAGTLTAAQQAPLTEGTVTATGGDTLTFMATPGSGVVAVADGFNPYTYIWNAWQAGVAGVLLGMQQTIQNNVYGTVGNLIILDIALLGILLIYGASSQTFWSKMFRAALVVTLLSGNVNYYATYVVQFFSTFSDTISGWLGLPGTTAGQFDIIVNLFSIKANATLAGMPVWTGSWFWAALQLTLASAAVVVGTTIAFLVWWLSQAALEVLFVFGPLFAPALLFDYFRGLWDAFISTCLHLALTAASAVLLASLVLNLMTNAIQGMPADSAGAATGLLRAAICVFGFSAVIAIFPWILSYICRGAVGAPSIWRHAGASAVANAPGAATGAVIGAAAVGVGRLTTAAGSSMSRAA